VKSVPCQILCSGRGFKITTEGTEKKLLKAICKRGRYQRN
jgi:hypothetical protein